MSAIDGVVNGSRHHAHLALGLDIGTSNTKACLVQVADGGAELLATARVATPAPATLSVTIAALVRGVLSGHAAPEVVGIASMAETGVPLDVGDRPLGDWLRWDGHRAATQARALADRLGPRELFGATGVRPAAKVPLATWAWMREHDAERWARMTRWAGVADLACLLLTGRLATDHTLAGRTQAYRLPITPGHLPAGFDADLLAEVGLRPEQLPDVVTDVPAGRVSSPELVDAGLRAGTPVVVAGHDHAVGAYAAGVREPGARADSVGTAEAVITVLAGDVPEGRRAEVAAAGMSIVVTVAGARQALLAGSSSAGAALAWWRDQSGRGLDDLPALVSAAGAGPTGVLVLPYVSGRQTPSPDPDASVRVVGLGDRPPAVLAKAVLEGICLHARWMTAEQGRLAARVAPRTPTSGPITLLGGPVVRNTAWTRVAAEVAAGPMDVADSPEPVAVGAALVAAERLGLASGALRLLAAPARPDARYDAVFERFIAAALDLGPEAVHRTTPAPPRKEPS